MLWHGPVVDQSFRLSIRCNVLSYRPALGSDTGKERVPVARCAVHTKDVAPIQSPAGALAGAPRSSGWLYRQVSWRQKPGSALALIVTSFMLSPIQPDVGQVYPPASIPQAAPWQVPALCRDADPSQSKALGTLPASDGVPQARGHLSSRGERAAPSAVQFLASPTCAGQLPGMPSSVPLTAWAGRGLGGVQGGLAPPDPACEGRM